MPDRLTVYKPVDVEAIDKRHEDATNAYKTILLSQQPCRMNGKSTFYKIGWSLNDIPYLLAALDDANKHIEEQLNIIHELNKSINKICSANNKIAKRYEEQQKSIDELTAENERLQADMWIPITERLPMDGEHVEIQKREEVISAYYDSSNQFWPWRLIGWPNKDTKDGSFSRNSNCVTHWRPQPPKESEGE